MMIGMWALYAREVKRFQKILLDTIASPIISMILYLAIFGIVAAGRSIDGIPYVTFVYTGLLGMILVNSSFSNPAYALVIAKNLGSIIDLQLVPIKSWQIGFAYTLAAMTRGILTVLVALLATIWFIPGLSIIHGWYLLAAIIITGIEFGSLGVVFGLWAKSFESLTFVTTFVMQPMIFLAGVFYPIADLPSVWYTISSWNPIHHTMNLLRYATTGYADVAPEKSLMIMSSIAIILFLWMRSSVQRGLRRIQH
jgi:ABC-2 type transport system permease protein